MANGLASRAGSCFTRMLGALRQVCQARVERKERRVGFEQERAKAELALAHDHPGDRPPFPSVEHLTRLRELAGMSEAELRRRFEASGQVEFNIDLELHDDERFDCQSVAELVHLGHVLGASVSCILFGEDPPRPCVAVSAAEVSARLRQRCADEQLTPDELGNQLGWGIEPVLEQAEALATFNIQGLRDVCAGVGVDWLAVVSALEARRRTTA